MTRERLLSGVGPKAVQVAVNIVIKAVEPQETTISKETTTLSPTGITIIKANSSWWNTK